MILNGSITNAENEDAGSLAPPAKGVQQKFAEAEYFRQRRRILRLIVLTWVAGIGIVIWAIAKALGR